MERIRLKTLSSHWMIPLLLMPVVIGVAVFAYLPAWEAIYHSFYRWDGEFTEEFVGLAHFERLLGDLNLWAPLLIGAALVGLSALMEGSRFRKSMRYVGVASLLLAAIRMVGDARLRMALEDPILQLKLQDFSTTFLLAVLFAVCVLGAVLMRSRPGKGKSWLVFLSYFIPIFMMGQYLIGIVRGGDQLLWHSFNLILILIVANLFKMWPSIFTAVCIHRLSSDRWQYIYRVLFVVPMIIPHMVGLLIWKFFYDPNVGVLNKVLIATGLDHVLIWLDKWVLHLGVFQEQFNPAWLGNEQLIISALVFWGFPWVGVVGVLIYLAGLQNIGNDVYEASDLDGVNWWGRFWYIELPLIMTQVRLNLVLMIIGTFQAYGFQLILLGAEGGPGNKGLTPGLYMYFQAFQENSYGFACAIGLILFFIILVLTIVNQKYVRVSK